ncbi:HK97-gp10 family putative phage morphogenesis protein [Undibacterium sp. MH2W]|uniref:HK97-gp10 family putative phage morphogenesis protein n=1 Tax=Undibacterium sp. MH2W TaxID=3413044 RepID=UPI003BF1034E
MDDISGLTELQAAINTMAVDLKKSLPDIVMASADVIEREIEIRAPERSGNLEKAIDTYQQTTDTQVTAIVQVDDSSPNQKEHYAIFQEFGTSKMAARPFFRPGIEAGRDKASNILIDGILGVIDEHAG